MSDDDNDICPLCCEELDLSDQQFFPCKCGYQVCMWCWHRIKESESGLCPACRTPYGDDPHEFSAVDMEEVVKANKEKALAEKRERERLRAMKEQEKREQLANYATASSTPSGGGTTNFAGALVSGGLGSTSAFGQFDGADLVAALGSASSSHKGPPEPPKDRSTLATMRVIRRNLVYAVGMPPNIATEENLRKPEYHGQYGKISKIVINRNHNPGDPRRASASAYVTFAHKEDALSCILALDGFYHDGRNIRASYGTSKYCSAFIKNVRCNNPDCTYLHHMGDAEDTFTKQEIQAGYVTSGRDVLARQQQIMAQQAAAVFGNSGAGNSRRKVGGGGPSGTGKASSSPIFPPPTYDEPLPRKARSAILQQRANMQHQPGGSTGAPSAASIVAGIGTTPAAPPAPHTTLTPLMPLNRGNSMPLTGKTAAVTSAMAVTAVAPKPTHPLVGGSSDLTPAESLALQEQRKEAALAQQQAQQRELMAMKQSAKAQQQQTKSAPSSPSHSSVGSGSGSAKGQIPAIRAESIGSSVKSQQSNEFISGPPIGAISGSHLHMGSPLIGSNLSGNLGGGLIGDPPISTVPPLEFGGSGILGGQPLALDDGRNGVIGGASLASLNNSFGGLGLLDSSSGGQADKWGALGGGFGGSGALWGDEPSNIRSSQQSHAPIGPTNRSINAPGDVGGMSLFGTSQNSYSNGGGSSALANMLGIELPTGSGSLRESSVPFSGGNPIQPPVGGVGAVGGLNASNGPVGAIGANKPNSGMLQPIGAPSQGVVGSVGSSGIPIGGYSGGGNNDMALLQSLLPGVNITSGNAYRPAAPQTNHQYQHQMQQQQQPVGVGGLNHQQWNSDNSSTAQQQQQHQEEQRSGNIW
mmetsp:Transcript_21881/g.52907  ORF Transcript_21881/g.52907 Transcript_21881/m.52907 type:complete len:867 (+) Transcript_21881:104-2704(+)